MDTNQEKINIEELLKINNKAEIKNYLLQRGIADGEINKTLWFLLLFRLARIFYITALTIVVGVPLGVILYGALYESGRMNFISLISSLIFTLGLVAFFTWGFYWYKMGVKRSIEQIIGKEGFVEYLLKTPVKFRLIDIGGKLLAAIIIILIVLFLFSFAWY